MKTYNLNKRELTSTICNYLIGCISFDDYDLDLPPVTPRNKILVLHGIFLSEYGHNLNKGKGEVLVIKDYLQCLPSVINVEFLNCEIIKLLSGWGAINGSETDEQLDDLIDQYWRQLAKKLSSLFYRAQKGEI